MAQPFLELESLSCTRSDRLLFDDLSISIAEGEILQIEGANGAGKTSLLRILCGFLTPDEGKVCFKGVDVANDPSTFQQELLYIGHQHGVKSALSVTENLAFYSGISSKKSKRSIFDAVREVGLYGYEDVHCSDLSAGQKRRVALARLLMSGAVLWILDEPFVALDVKAVAWLEAILIDHAKCGGTVIFTSHQAFGSDYDIRRLRI